MKEKISFVLWSGGLDSSYLVQKLLDEDKDKTVWTGYVKLINNQDKTIQEDRARNAMIPIFQKKYGSRFKDFGTICEMAVNMNNHWSPLIQMPIWFNALIASTPPETDEVCLGYVMNDCAISYLEDIKALFRTFSKRISSKPFPKVVFPLSKMIKEDICYGIDKELKSHVVWCEMPRIKYKKETVRENPEPNMIYDDSPVIESITPCGHCVSCQHSPILEHGKALPCEGKCMEEEEDFSETYNKSGEAVRVDKLLTALEEDEREATHGQKFFDFYEDYSEELIYSQKKGIHPKRSKFIKKRIQRSKAQFAVKKSIY
jgi:hypothetical protein